MRIHNSASAGNGQGRRTWEMCGDVGMRSLPPRPIESFHKRGRKRPIGHPGNRSLAVAAKRGVGRCGEGGGRRAKKPPLMPFELFCLDPIVQGGDPHSRVVWAGNRRKIPTLRIGTRTEGSGPLRNACRANKIEARHRTSQRFTAPRAAPRCYATARWPASGQFARLDENLESTCASPRHGTKKGVPSGNRSERRRERRWSKCGPTLATTAEPTLSQILRQLAC